MIFQIVSMIDRQVVSVLIPQRLRRGLGGVVGGVALGLIIDYWFRRGVRGIALRLLALAVLASNLFGFAFGPMLVGAITDYGFADPNKVGASVAVVLVTICPLAAWMIWCARGDFVLRLDMAPVIRLAERSPPGDSATLEKVRL